MMYEVERLLGKVQLPGAEAYFLVQWKDYPLEESTWEPFENLSSLRNEMFRLVDGQMEITPEEFETVRQMTLDFVSNMEQKLPRRVPKKVEPGPSESPAADPPKSPSKGPQLKKVKFQTVTHPKNATKRNSRPPIFRSQMKIRRRFIESDSSEEDEEFFSLY